MVELATGRLAEARVREEDATRRALYERARKLSDEAAKVMRRYPGLALQIIDIVRQVAQAEAAINQANESLPDGAAPLSSVEFAVRGLPADPRQEVSRRIIREAWFYNGTDSELDERVLRTLETRDGQFGSVTGEYGARLAVERREIERIDFLEHRPAYMPDPLHLAIRLPHLLPGDPDLWVGVGSSPEFYFGHMGADADAIPSDAALADHVEQQIGEARQEVLHALEQALRKRKAGKVALAVVSAVKARSAR